jgi:hypothetical protein
MNNLEKLNVLILDIFIFILPVVFIIGNIMIRQGIPRGQQLLVVGTISYIVLEFIKYLIMMYLFSKGYDHAYVQGYLRGNYI